MSKTTDVADLLGTPEKTAPAKKAAAKKAAPAAPAAKKAAAEKPAAKTAPAAKKAAPAKKAAAEKTTKDPVTFEDGERDEILARIKKAVKKDINSRDLALKLEVPTRKLRQVLYTAQRQGVVTLLLEGGRVGGMTVSPA